MRLYAEARKRKKGLVYTSSLASLFPVRNYIDDLTTKAQSLTDLPIPPVWESTKTTMSRATIYLHPFHTTRRKRGPGKGRTICKEYRAARLVHHWPTDVAEEIYDALFHPFKGTRTHLLKTKTSEEIEEWYLEKCSKKK